MSNTHSSSNGNFAYLFSHTCSMTLNAHVAETLMPMVTTFSHALLHAKQHFPTLSVTPFIISFFAWLHLQESFAPQLMSNWKPLALFLWHPLAYDPADVGLALLPPPGSPHAKPYLAIDITIPQPPPCPHRMTHQHHLVFPTPTSNTPIGFMRWVLGPNSV